MRKPDPDIIRTINDIRKEAYNISKLDHCLCCNRKCNSFCNSHTLPKFVLKNISESGHLYNWGIYSNMPIANGSKGINSSCTFRRICHDCDNRLFQQYESSDSLKFREPSNKMMAQIDLKNSLRMYDKKLIDEAICKLPNRIIGENYQDPSTERMQNIFQLDINELKNDIQNDLDMLSGKSTSKYRLIYRTELKYVVPIAFQGRIALLGDLEGKIINDIYSTDGSYVIEAINICVFPLSNSSIILIFVKEDYRRYDEFLNQFKKLKKNEKLRLISYIIFHYSEDFLIAESAKESILKNEDLIREANDSGYIFALNREEEDAIKQDKIGHMTDYKNFPNLLARENAIRA